MTVPVPLTDNESHTIDVGPVYCPSCKREYGNTEAEALREALRIAVDTLKVVAADGSEYWQCTAALVRIAALDPRPTTEAGDDGG